MNLVEETLRYLNEVEENKKSASIAWSNRTELFCDDGVEYKEIYPNRFKKVLENATNQEYRPNTKNTH